MTNNPDPNSKRSKRRANRNFTHFSQSRKHKRARRRQICKRSHYGRIGEPGDKMTGGGATFVHTAGGSIDYHS